MLYLPHEDGQGLVEYGLILVLVSIAAVGLMAVLGDEMTELFQEVADTMEAARER